MSKCIRPKAAIVSYYRGEDGRPIEDGKYVYRILWEKANGPLPQGMVLHHKCDNVWCCNLKHLEPMTRAEHAAHHLKGRLLRPARTHCANGHPYDEENTRWVNSSRDGRYKACRICDKATKRRYRDVRKP